MHAYQQQQHPHEVLILVGHHLEVKVYLHTLCKAGLGGIDRPYIEAAAHVAVDLQCRKL